MKKIFFLLLLQLNSYLLLSQTNDFMFERAVPYVSDNKWGWADVYTNEILIEPKYDFVDFDYRSGFMIFNNGKVGLVKCGDKNHCFEIISIEYDRITSNRYGYVTSINNKEGYINLKNEKIIDNLYDNILFDSNYIFLFNKEKYKSGVFDRKTNEQIIPLNYEIISIDYEKLISHYKEFEKDALIKFDIFLDKNGKYFFFNVNRSLKEIKLKDNSFLQEITNYNKITDIGVDEFVKDDVILKATNNFNIGNRYKEEKFKIGKVKLYNSNKYFHNYLIVQNKSKDKYGLINTNTDIITLEPEYDEIKIIKNHFDYFVIAIKNQKQTLLFKDKKISENEYDEIEYNETRDNIILKKNGLFGIVFINRKRSFNEEENVKFVTFEPKYTNFNYSKYSNGYNGVSVLNVTDNENKNYYISNFGFEYKK